MPALHPGNTAFLFTHLHVREDAMVLYGFATRDERDTFEVLLGASHDVPGLAVSQAHVGCSLTERPGRLDPDEQLADAHSKDWRALIAQPDPVSRTDP